MGTEKKTGKFMENARTERPLNPLTDDRSLNSEIHATTAINSSVKPEQYPKEKRDAQVAAATGAPGKSGK